MRPVDTGGGGGNDGGSNITSAQTRTMVVQWGLSPGCPAPDYFEVIAYTGVDPTATSAWLWNPQVQLTPAAAAKTATTLGTAQPYAAQIKYSVPATLGAVTPAVRTVYLSGQTLSQAPVRPRPLAPIGGGVP